MQYELPASPIPPSLAHRDSTLARLLISSSVVLEYSDASPLSLHRMCRALTSASKPILSVQAHESKPDSSYYDAALNKGKSLLRIDGKNYENYRSVFLRYDAFFGINRIRELNDDRRLFQVAKLVELLAQDLPDCLLDASQIARMLYGLSIVLCGRTMGQEEVVIEADSEQTSEGKSMRKAKQPVAELAMKRWKIGHYVFNLSILSAAGYLQRAAKVQELEVVCADINAASDLVRASTAAMWYAEAFPSRLYMQEIRPAMTAASGKISGFSGEDNLEFRYFNVHQAALERTLLARFGEYDTWPEELWQSLYGFLETRQSDIEHHTLLAEKVVGSAPSIKHLQLMQKAGGSLSASDRPAVDALREIGDRVKAKKEAMLG